MSSRLIYNIKQLVNTREESYLLRGAALADLPCIDHAWVHIEDDRIAAYGPMSALPQDLRLLIENDSTRETGDPSDRAIDAGSRFVPK